MKTQKRAWNSGLVTFGRASTGLVKALRRNELQGMIPFLVLLYLIGAALLLLKVASPVAPFVYTLF